jgi:hypothetical protein
MFQSTDLSVSDRLPSCVQISSKRLPVVDLLPRRNGPRPHHLTDPQRVAASSRSKAHVVHQCMIRWRLGELAAADLLRVIEVGERARSPRRANFDLRSRT